MNIAPRSSPQLAVKFDFATKSARSPARFAGSGNSGYSVGERVIRKSDSAAGTVIEAPAGDDDSNVYVLFDSGVSQKVSPGDLERHGYIANDSSAK